MTTGSAPMYCRPVDTGPTVRAAVNDDAEVAIDVIRRSISELCVADHKNDPKALAEWLANKTAAGFHGWLGRPGQYGVVAEFDGTLCGVGMLSSEGEVLLCYVHPEFTLRGVGRALVAAMEANARERGHKRLHLDATVSATCFYESIGFVRTGSPSASNPYEKQLIEPASSQ